MASPDSTRWTVIRGAAAGESLGRAEFARRYAPVIRAYLGARWRGRSLSSEIEDAAQEVFVACFEPDGPLTRADPQREGGFRAYLYGIVRNVARGMEKKGRARAAENGFDLDGIEGRAEQVSRAFDRAWATSLLRQAGERQALRARGDERAGRRVDLLRLRFHDDLPIREIAKLWDVDAAHLHEEYRRARREFLAELREVVREHHGGSSHAIEAECARLLDLL